MTPCEAPSANGPARDEPKPATERSAFHELAPTAKPSQSFCKLERLTTRSEYLRVQQRGDKIHLRDLLVFVHPRAGARRIGITASSKVGGAVQRNRVKRLLREVWRRHRAELPQANDLVFVAKRTAVGMNYVELQRQFLELAHRLRRREQHEQRQP